jgi:hypothetical protein
MQRRAFLGYLFAGIGGLVLAASTKAEAVASSVPVDATPELPDTEFSSKGGHSGRRGHGHGHPGGRGRHFGWSRGRHRGWFMGRRRRRQRH